MYCAQISLNQLNEVHSNLCHPGVTRMYHYVCAKNLPYSLDEIRKMTASCKICAEVKPRFYKPSKMHVIKATRPIERLSIDFKSLIENLNRNNYMLTVIDEYSRFLFAFPCSNINAEIINKCLTQLFSLFGLCSCIHSNRGSAFMSKEFIAFLRGKGIAYSRTSVYNLRGNGQCEKYNDVIWSGVKLALKSRNWPLSKWDVVLIDVLHSIRSLLCTGTNRTSHERFLTSIVAPLSEPLFLLGYLLLDLSC